MSSHVRDVLSEKVLRVDAGVPVSDMRVTMRGRCASHVAVIAQGQCLGVSNLTDADLASDDATFGDLVDIRPYTPVSETTSVEELVRLFADTNDDSQIVQNDRGEFVGVVTRQSLLEGLLKDRGQGAGSAQPESVIEQRLRRTQEIAHVGNFELAADGSPTYWSDECFRILGLETDSEIPSREYLLKHVIHPDDLELSQRTVQQALTECSSFSYEYRVLRPDGSMRWVHCRGEPVLDDEGQLASFAGALLDVTERKQANDSLIEMNVALSNAMPGISRLDTSGRFVEINHLYANSLGYEPEELIGGEWAPTVHPDDIPTAIQAYEVMCRDGKGEFEARAVRKDDSQFHKRVLMVRIDDADGVMSGHHCFMRDISERKQAEDALREQVERYELITEGANDAIWDWDVRNHSVYFSSRWKELRGLAPDDVSDREEEWSNEIHPDDAPRVMVAVLAHHEGKTPFFKEEYRIRCKNGSYKWILDRGIAKRDTNGVVVRMAGSESDITDRREAAEAVRVSQERLDLAVRGASDGLWDWDIESGKQFWSPRFTEMLGYGEDEVEASFDQFLALLHSDDVERVQQALREHLEDRKPYDIELRLRKKSGEYGWFRSRAEALRDEEGRDFRMAGSIRDITERKQAEDALRESEARFRNLFENAPDAIFLLEDGIWTDCNQAAVSMLRGSREQIVGHSPIEFSPEFQPDGTPSDVKAITTIREAMETGSTQFEWVHRRLDGTECYAEISAVAMSIHGQDTLYGTVRDITERKQAEELLKELVEGTASVTGAEFFSSFVSALARVFKSRYILVCEHLESPLTRVRTLAFWMIDHLADNIEYDLAGTPCRETADGENTFYANGLQAIFPEDKILIELEAESFCGVPLRDSSGQVIGHLVIMDDHPMDVNLFDVPAMQIFASRAAAELERKRADEALRASETRSRTLLEGSPICIKIVDLDFRLQYMSCAGREQLKISDIEPFYGTNFPPELYPEFWRAPVIERLERAKLGETCSLECPVLDTEGNKMWFDTTFVPARDGEGRIQHLILTSVNVTKRKQAEDDARKLQAELAHVSRVSVMGEMATGLAHELNQPLAAIVTYCHVAKDMANQLQGTSADLCGVLGSLEDQAMRAGEVVRRLRGFLRKSDSVRVLADLNLLVRDVTKFVDPDIRKAEVSIELEFDRPTIHVVIDEIQIQQVLVNLIRNAVDAMSETPTDQRTLIVSNRILQGGRVEVAVKDAGKGLPPDELKQAFNAFFTTKQEGMGMGLAISRSIVEAHSGKLWARPNTDRGVTFGFTLPCESRAVIDGGDLMVFVVDDGTAVRNS